MSGTDKPTRADDFSRLMGILRDAPPCGLSMEEIQKTTEAGEKWSYRTINDLLVGLGSRVKCEKIRTKQGKVAKYTMRSTT